MSDKPREYDTVTYYMGRPVSEMSRVELIEAINALGRMMEDQHRLHQSELQVWRSMANRRVSA